MSLHRHPNHKRNLCKKKILYKTAREKGVKNFDRFTNAGYKGLYNGETANDIAKRVHRCSIEGIRFNGYCRACVKL